MKIHRNLLDALLGDDLEAVQTRSRRRSMLPIDIQLFSNGGAGGDGGSDGTGDGGNGGDGGTGSGGAEGTDGAGGDDNGKDDDLETKIEKLAQSKADKMRAKERKEFAEMKKELEKLRKEKMSADEIKELEMKEKEKALAEKDKALTEKGNRIFAIQAIKTAGLDDGGDTSALVDLVIAGSDVTEDSITERVTAIKGYFDKRVAAEVDKIFKENGRNPNGSGSGSGDKDGDDSIAVKLGKQRAERNKKSNDALKFYGIGG